jgi:ribose transport system permease protein
VRNGAASWIIVAAVVVLLVAASPGTFLRSSNVAGVLSDCTVLGLVGIGETFVLLSGGIDLSVGSLATLTTVLVAGMINGHAALVLPVVLLMMAIGAAVGCMHGVLVTKAGISPFIVTLSSYFILAGIAYGYTSLPVGSVPTGVSNFFLGSVGPLPWSFLIVAVIGTILSIILARTRFGRHVYAVGGDPESARTAGLNVARITILCYVLSGVLAALAGCVLAFRAGVGTPNAGSGLELLAITASVIGGTSLTGGRGRLLGTAGGVVLLSLVQDAFLLLAVESYYQNVVTGAVIVFAVAIFVES